MSESPAERTHCSQTSGLVWTVRGFARKDLGAGCPSRAPAIGRDSGSAACVFWIIRTTPRCGADANGVKGCRHRASHSGPPRFRAIARGAFCEFACSTAAASAWWALRTGSIGDDVREAGRLRAATWQWMPAHWPGQLLRADRSDKPGVQFPKRMGRRRKTPPMSGTRSRDRQKV